MILHEKILKNIHTDFIYDSNYLYKVQIFWTKARIIYKIVCNIVELFVIIQTSLHYS